MNYKLTNGEIVHLKNNFDVAIFCYLIAPFKGLCFDGTVPKIVVTPEVERVIKIQKRLYKNKQIAKANQVALDKYLAECDRAFGSTWDDDIPF